METIWTELDVRPLLAKGREPLALITNNLAVLESGQGLRLVAPFYPEPLLQMLQGPQWDVATSQREDKAWQLEIRKV